MSTKKQKRKKFSDFMTSPLAGLKYGLMYALGFSLPVVLIYSNLSFGHNAGFVATIFFFTLNPLFMLFSAPWSILFHEGLHMDLSYSIALGGSINIIALAVLIGLFRAWRSKRKKMKLGNDEQQ